MASLLAAARTCEAGGVELLVLDGRGATGTRLDVFALLGAVASVTTSLIVAALAAADERAPSLFAKATATLDVCSSGRAALLLSPGGGREPGAALAHLGECLGVVSAMLAGEAPTVSGEQVAVERAWNEPRLAGHVPPLGAVLATGVEDTARLASWPLDWLVLEAPTWSRARSASWAAAPATSPGRLVLAALGDETAADLEPGGAAAAIVAVGDPRVVEPGIVGQLVAAARGGRSGGRRRRGARG